MILAALPLLVGGCKGREAPVAAVAPDAGATTRSQPPTTQAATPAAIQREDGRGERAAPPGDLGPEGRPVIACPVKDRLDLYKALDEASSRYDRGDYATALACAQLAARIDPSNVEAHHDRALALAALERWDEAKQAFTRALAIDPDDPETLAGAADLYINRLAPSHELTEIGLEYARRGSQTVGRRRADRELASRLAVLEAQALDDLGRSDEALPRAEAAVTLDPTSVDARYERAVILFHLCRFDRAKAAFLDVLKRAPDDPFVHLHLGLILEREGKIAEAETHFARAHALAPDKFPRPVLLDRAEFQALVDRALRELPPETQKLLEGVAIEIADVPALEDLMAVEPPFAPTILGLYRGASIDDPTGSDEPRAIVLYRKNLARAVATRAELEKQVRVTLWHEIGHLKGRDEHELRERGLE